MDIMDNMELECSEHFNDPLRSLNDIMQEDQERGVPCDEETFGVSNLC